MAGAERVRKGWFVMDGQDGDRTLEEQMLGVTPALAECAGKTVLDLGSAEGLIGRELARAGALSVHGIDSVQGHIDEARKQCAGLPMTFELAELESLASRRLKEGKVEQFDIVLALAVLHKMRDPAIVLEFAAQSTLDLLVIRLPIGSTGDIRFKYATRDGYAPGVGSVNAQAFLAGRFTLERMVEGARGELVQHWRKK